MDGCGGQHHEGPLRPDRGSTARRGATRPSTMVSLAETLNQSSDTSRLTLCPPIGGQAHCPICWTEVNLSVTSLRSAGACTLYMLSFLDRDASVIP
jgi:hypothetical protein